MQFPNTMQTARTEAYMAAWRKENPTADTSAYNRKYEETYERFGSDTDAKSPGPVNRHEEVWQHSQEGASLAMGIGVSSDDAEVIMRAKSRAYGRQPKHAAQTKGAFGKAKRR